jgi:hypothetical protein
MKKLKKVLLFVALLVMACSMTTQAATKTVTKVTTLKQNTWSAKKYSDYSYSAKTGTGTYTYYMNKIVIPADGYISVSGTANADTYIRLYTSTKAAYDGSVRATMNSITAIDKGTYYVYGDKNFSFKYTFTKAVNSTNYCIAKATTLASGKKVTVCNTSSYFYDRWYKVVLKKKQQINLYVSTGDGSNIKIVSSKLDEYDMAHDGNHYYTQATLAKGTYYIRVRAYQYDPLLIFYWK